MKVLTIANIETPVIEHNDQPVVTTEQLAEFYGCKKDAISHNFKNNESRFVEGKHFYKLTGDNLKSFKALLGNAKISQNLKFAPYVYLWTKQGAARHSKMLGTDRAWDMFDLLEENYFNKKQEPKSQIDILVESAKALQRQERELVRLKLTQEQLAHVAGVTDTCYQAYEYGIREPKARTAIRIAKALGTTVEELWDSNPTK